MNKNVELFDIEMDRGQAESLFNFRMENSHLTPVFLLPKRNMGMSRRDFNDWWSGRRIPASRTGVKELLWKLEGMGLDELAEKALGLSLSDQFWIRPSLDIKWEDVNFFQNEFSEDIGKLLTTGDWQAGNELASPDNTSDGVVKKRWKIINGTRCLIKGSFGPPWHAQPFRELFAYKIAQILLEPFSGDFVVPYWLIEEDELIYSVCPNFVTVDTEYVAFNQINQAYKKPNHISHYNFIRGFYKGYEHVLDLTLVLDYIVLNEDRHFGNFGLIRCTNTGEFLRPAPIFDTGSALFYDSPSVNRFRVESKPFHKNFDTQIKMVDTEPYMESILAVKSQYEEIFHEVFKTSQEDDKRKQQLLEAVTEQLRILI